MHTAFENHPKMSHLKNCFHILCIANNILILARNVFENETFFRDFPTLCNASLLC